MTVIAPVNEPNQGYVVYEDTRRASSGRRLEKTLKRLREAGVTAQGFVVDTGPVQAVKDALDRSVKDLGLTDRVQVQAVGCLRLCCNGPLLQVDPTGELFAILGVYTWQQQPAAIGALVVIAAAAFAAEWAYRRWTGRTLKDPPQRVAR